ncbi:hypothetical protein ACPD8N_00065 [Lacticaseibacillus chiayiensis]|uniref:hypothetical protein n=1 Tax=Lacticaseibacillus chiayiensis TaxID=2100821 RepID=UPI003C78494D
MSEFDWEEVEQDEYSRSARPSFVKLTTRSYITAMGVAPDRLADATFIDLAAAVTAVAKQISEGPNVGIKIPNFKAYRPYPLQAVWSGGDKISNRRVFRIWLKQPLFIQKEQFTEAVAQLDFDPAIATQLHFEQLAEGFEIQSFSDTPLDDSIAALTRIQTTIADHQLVPKFNDRHREVYVAGYAPDSPVLLRVALDENFGQVDEAQVVYN